MSATASRPPLANHILAALVESDYQMLAPHLKVVSFKSGDILSEPSHASTHFYFPVTAVFSLITVMSNGRAVEAQKRQRSETRGSTGCRRTSAPVP